VSYQPAVDAEVIAAVLKMASLRLTKLYRNLSQLEELRELDEDFHQFVSSIPQDHEDVVRLVVSVRRPGHRLCPRVRKSSNDAILARCPSNHPPRNERLPP